MGRKSKGIYKKHSIETMQTAVQCVQNIEMTVRAASKEFGISKSTQSDHVTGKITDGAVAGKAPVIPIEIENKLVEKVVTAADKGFGMSRKNLLIRTARLCKNMKIKTNFKNGLPGKDWYTGLEGDIQNFL